MRGSIDHFLAFLVFLVMEDFRCRETGSSEELAGTAAVGVGGDDVGFAVADACLRDSELAGLDTVGERSPGVVSCPKKMYLFPGNRGVVGGLLIFSVGASKAFLACV